VSEETQAPEPGASAAARAADPAAVALTGASRTNADAFLDDQRAMLHLQMEEMRERNPFELSHLHWQRFADRMKAALQVMTVLVGLAVAAAFAGNRDEAARHFARAATLDLTPAETSELKEFSIHHM
jgi:hypothetical protein